LRHITRKSLLILAGVAALATTAFAGSASADPDADGEKLFKRCAACHSLDAGKNKVGPSLAGVIGRTSGTAPGYKYSALNSAAGEAGLVWTTDNLIAYLPDPTSFLTDYLKANNMADKAEGRTKMTFKMPKEDDREAIAAYLASQSK
jgi:cytochrome c